MGIVYELCCLNTNKKYVGSSILTKEQRLQYHEYHYKFYLKDKHNYVSSFEILENGNYIINILENVEDNMFLTEREQYYYEKGQYVNKKNPKVNAEILKKRQKKDNELYKQRNPIKWKENQDKRKIKINCECGISVSKRNIARHIKTHKK
jgi:hypothetical protein